VQRAVYAAELRVIERIERVSAQLQPDPLFPGKFLLEGDVPVINSRIDHVVPRRVQSSRADRRNRERRRVQATVRVVGSGPRVSDQVQTETFGVRSGEILVTDTGDADSGRERRSSLEDGPAG